MLEDSLYTVLQLSTVSVICIIRTED